MDIKNIAYYLPEKILTNAELEKRFPDLNAEKIVKKVGIESRHIAEEHETALDFAFRASQALFEKIPVKPDEIDFLISCTQSPDYFLPMNATILQDRLGMRTDIGAFDFNLGCSGYIYGLMLAKSLIESKVARRVLLTTGDTYSKYIHPLDKGNLTIFGDGATATLIEQADIETIGQFVLGSDGAGYNNLIVPNGGLRTRFQTDAEEIADSHGGVRTANCLYMNGPEIFNFTIEKVPLVVEQVLAKNGLTLGQVDYIVFHQANKYILKYLRDLMQMDPDKFHIDLADKGNTVSSTIPIALKDAYGSGKIKKGDKVLLVGFGVGYSWGGTMIEIA